MAITPPERIWWKPLGPHERLWVAISTLFVLALFVTMPLWQTLSKQATPEITYRVTSAQYREMVSSFIKRYQVGQEGYLPVVAPPPGDVYLMAQQWQWTPILRLVKGQAYKLHLGSVDVNHGFSLQPVNINFQIVPGYDQVVELTPTEAGEYTVVCNEFCGVGHQMMIGRIVVVEK